MTSTPRSIALLAISTLALTGCSAAGGAAHTDTSTPTSSATATTSVPAPTTVTPTTAPTGSTADKNKDFALALPSGWITVDKVAGVGGLALGMRSKAQEDGYYTNITVLRQTAPDTVTLTDLVNQGSTAMRQEGGTVSTIADRRIGGEPAKGYASDRPVQGVKVSQTQFYVLRAGKVYVITLSCSQPRRTAATATLTALLDSWVWTR
ncbi:DUF1795 domain-containing protein [Calidifontibacter sp. DB0510]|uniref:DUF1795 domain-containing protein n=1 Tax=Metallococcus carri TaxID=1656884 RepID=A0A967B1C3_9MICO|nr:DUF1795 domain-containing protein [Metallococcus carri]NHN56498.1 DUF1795 domain-containing protein [Metallococcus carri]NOP36122.1 hypothetical protein [Calidifontibacter sp. DB2511S]